MTTNEIVKVYTKLSEMRKDGQRLLPAKVAFAIVRNLRKLQPIVEDYELTCIDILESNGAQRSLERPGSYTLPTEDTEKIAFINQQIEQVGKAENSDVILMKIKCSELDGLDLSIDEMDALYSMIEEEEG